MHRHDARRLLELYPRIFFACHVRHVRDPKTRRELSFHQASILDHLDDREPTSLMHLAAHMGVTASTMSITVDRLVRSGYVVRRNDPSDGRRVGLLLTPAGLRIKRTDRVLDPARVRAMLSRLAPAEIAEGLRGLELLAGAADREVQARGGGKKRSKS
ncbi:MAG: MarR family winged helix-turn-helix transcriptional regulator [Bryobacteraceae bacterium]